jgi:hypothetical protein
MYEGRAKRGRRSVFNGAVMDTIILLIGASLLMVLVVMIDIWLTGVDS